MKVLFVSSGNSKNGISPIVKGQGESLINQGVELKYFSIKGKGFWGYIRNLPKLRKLLKEEEFDIVHAHYSLSGIVATLSGSIKPLIVSLMGSDVKVKFYFRFALWFFYRFFWKLTIVKSEDMKQSLKFKGLKVKPNGVDIEMFKPLNARACKKELGWDTNLIHILFAANPDRQVKNFNLAIKAIEKLVNNKIELHTLTDIPHSKMPLIMNASDLILLTSLWEGSPNVIKEAMACNKPIVSTNVGDVEWLFGKEEGHLLTSFDPKDISDRITQAINFATKKKYTRGRNRLIKLELDSTNVAKKIMDVYHSVL